MRLLFNCTKEDKFNKGELAHLLGPDRSAILSSKEYDQTELLAASNLPQVKADAILCSNPNTLSNLVPGAANPSDWRGSILRYSTPVLCIAPLHHIHSVTSGEWLLRQDLAKLSQIHKPAHKLDFTVLNTAKELKAHFNLYRSTALFLVIDIETSKSNLITEIGFTFFDTAGKFHNYIVPFRVSHWIDEDEWERVIGFIREYLSTTDMPKCFHNGAYDNYYLLRYRIACKNYILDTEYLWYCWFTELNKSLAFISSILLHDTYYWKEENQGDEYERQKYCAKDCWYTARCLIQILTHIPDWALVNYSKKFPEVFSAINVKFFGFLVDKDIHHELKTEAEDKILQVKSNLAIMADEPDFNPGSWQQVSKLLYEILGAQKPSRRGKHKSKAGTDETSLKRISIQHPLIERFVDDILTYRGETKAVGTYYNAVLYEGRLKFAQNIDGTDTGRHSSNKLPMYVPNPSGLKKDEKNYGTNLQNQPIYMRKCLQADPGFWIGEVDKKQSEARYTAYLAQDQELIKALEGDTDFYIHLTKLFFGIELDPNDPTLKDRGNPRQITKKIVHGSNYIMGAETFVDEFIKEIGYKELREAQKMLGMEKKTLVEFATFLLSLYHKGCPMVGKWWDQTKIQLVKFSRITTADGWTRLFFGDARKDHGILRSAVAHQPQHLSVAGINKSMGRLLELQFDSRGDYIMMAQQHDSILFQAKINKFDYYMQATIDRMKTTDRIHGRELTVPLEASYGTHWKPMKEWKA